MLRVSLRRLMLICVSALLVSACGKKGPLYLPKKDAPVEQVSPHPATLPPR